MGLPCNTILMSTCEYLLLCDWHSSSSYHFLSLSPAIKSKFCYCFCKWPSIVNRRVGVCSDVLITKPAVASVLRPVILLGP